MALPVGWKSEGVPIESGQAHVFCASHAKFEFRCALKRLKNPKRAERFARELEVMTYLATAGVAVPAVVASDLQDAKPWYAMRWFDDGSMEKLLTADSLDRSLTEDVGCLMTLGRAIADVHIHGVAHRDLKPANVLMDGDRLLLTDFGLCLPIDDEDRLTETAEAIGSRLYIAPENESGIREELDQRPADFYAFGKICWSVMLHRQPLARELAVEPANSVVRLRDDVRLAPLDVLIRDLLVRDPRARLHDWDVVLRELEAIASSLLEFEPVQVPVMRTSVLDAARMLRELPQVADADERRKERDRVDTWKASLLREMMAAARLIENLTGDLHEALDGMLTIVATTGGAAELSMLMEVHQIMPPVTPLEQAVVLLLHSQTGIEAFPTMAVRIGAYIDDAGGVHFASVPELQQRGQAAAVAEGLLPWLAQRIGPNPMFRQATVDVARRFVAENVVTFVAVTHHYIVVLNAGGDPGDAGAWKDADLQLDRVELEAVATGDVTPPDLRSFELIPGDVHVGESGGTVRCRVRLVDDGAGVAGTGYTSSPSQARLASPSGQMLHALFTDQSLISGDSHDGVYEDCFAFTPSAERGRWVIDAVMTVDSVGNTRRYSAAELRELGFRLAVQVR
jgi:tRNA A-37 threonylcarbamoyl transferase component Bud32